MTEAELIVLVLIGKEIAAIARSPARLVARGAVTLGVSGTGGAALCAPASPGTPASSPGIGN